MAAGEHRQDDRDRHKTSREAEALLLQDDGGAVAVGGDQAVEDLLLGLALLDEPRDLTALGVGLGPLGDRQRDAAGDARDLVETNGVRGGALGSGGGLGCGAGEGERGERGGECEREVGTADAPAR